MGFFDYLMKGIGFETDIDPTPAVKKQKTKRVNTEASASANTSMQAEQPASNAPYNFAFPSYNPSLDEADNMQVTSMQDGVASAKNVIVYKPKTQGDIKNLIDFLRRKEPIIVNFALLPQEVSASMIAFISGALYALRGSIHPIANNLYLLTPEGVSILVPRDQAPKY